MGLVVVHQSVGDETKQEYSYSISCCLGKRRLSTGMNSDMDYCFSSLLVSLIDGTKTGMVGVDEREDNTTCSRGSIFYIWNYLINPYAIGSLVFYQRENVRFDLSEPNTRKPRRPEINNAYLATHHGGHGDLWRIVAFFCCRSCNHDGHVRT